MALQEEAGGGLLLDHLGVSGPLAKQQRGLGFAASGISQTLAERGSGRRHSPLSRFAAIQDSGSMTSGPDPITTKRD